MFQMDSKLFLPTSPIRIKRLSEKESKRSSCDDTWNSQYDVLLRDWMKKGKLYRCLHTYSNEYYIFWHYILSIPILVLSTGIGMTTFAFVSPDKPTRFEYISQYIVSFLNVLVAILSGILQLSKCSEYAVRHQRAAIEYTKFYRSIQMELSLEYCHRSNPIDFCRYKRMVLDNLLDDSMQIPKIVDKKMKNKLNARAKERMNESKSKNKKDTNQEETNDEAIEDRTFDMFPMESYCGIETGDDQSERC